MDPMLFYATTSKAQLQIGLELLLDTCSTFNNFAYNRSLTAQPARTALVEELKGLRCTILLSVL